MSVFATHPCVICHALIRWEDECCSAQCEVELDRRREGPPEDAPGQEAA